MKPPLLVLVTVLGALGVGIFLVVTAYEMELRVARIEGRAEGMERCRRMLKERR
jgi:hypothetical protein